MSKDGEACVEVTGANLDLATVSTSDDARTAADILEKYGPPQSTQDAIGEWVKQVCP